MENKIINFDGIIFSSNCTMPLNLGSHTQMITMRYLGQSISELTNKKSTY